MEEIFKQRKVELEIVAKNTIVDIHLIGMQIDENTKVLELRKKQLESINSSLIELNHAEKLIKVEQDRREAQAPEEKKVQVPKEKE